MREGNFRDGYLEVWHKKHGLRIEGRNHPLRRTKWPIDACSRSCLSGAELEVRIHSAPAVSLRTIGSRNTRSSLKPHLCIPGHLRQTVAPAADLSGGVIRQMPATATWSPNKHVFSGSSVWSRRMGAIQASRLRRGGLPAQTVALLRGTDAPASLCLI